MGESLKRIEDEGENPSWRLYSRVGSKMLKFIHSMWHQRSKLSRKCTDYIGKHLKLEQNLALWYALYIVPILLNNFSHGHHMICCCREKQTISPFPENYWISLFKVRSSCWTKIQFPPFSMNMVRNSSKLTIMFMLLHHSHKYHQLDHNQLKKHSCSLDDMAVTFPNCRGETLKLCEEGARLERRLLRCDFI